VTWESSPRFNRSSSPALAGDSAIDNGQELRHDSPAVILQVTPSKTAGLLEINTFGAIELRRDGTEVRSVLSQPRRFALFVHLLLAAPGGYIARDRLLGVFWPEADSDRARNALRQALHFLRRSLGEDVITSRADREVGVDAAAVRCDALAFQEALRDGRPADALDLYRGEFLPGFYLDDAPELERWVEDVRAEFRGQALRAAASLADEAATDGRSAEAVRWQRRVLALDPLGEAAVRRLMTLLAGSGDRAGALEVATAFERRLAAELDLSVSPETAELAAAIRVGEFAPASPAPDSTAVTPVTPVTPVALAAAASREGAAPALPPPAPAGALPREQRPAWSGRPWLLLVATLLIVVAAAAGWLLRQPTHRPAADDPPSVAVLPFLNMSGDAANEYLADGMTEELLNVLTQVPGLKVAARTSSFAFKGKDVAIDSIGRALGVSHVLEGSVRITGARVRITAQLIEAASGFHLWSQNFDRELSDLFQVQDEIAMNIARQLQLELAGNLWGMSAAETRDPEAHRLLLRGLHAFRTPTRESYAEAVALLEEAVGRDPQYARALGALAHVLAWQAALGFAPPDSAYPRASAMAHRSLAIRETPEAHLALARLAEVHAYDPDSADAHMRRALELRPGDARAMQLRAILLARGGRGTEAVPLARRATELDPLHPGSWSNYATVLAILDRDDEALPLLEHALTLAPDDRLILRNLAATYSNAGHFEQALRHAQRLETVDPGDPATAGLMAHLLFRTGRTDEALRRAAQLETDTSFPRFNLAVLYASTPDTAKVLDLLEESYRRGEPDIVQIRSPEMFTGLRQQPRYRRLLVQVGQR
jgi:adenylate cyclase